MNTLRSLLRLRHRRWIAGVCLLAVSTLLAAPAHAWTQSTVYTASGFAPLGLSSSAAGTFYVADSGSSSLVRLSGGSASTVVGGLSGIQSVAWAPSGSDFTLVYTQSSAGVTSLPNSGGAYQSSTTVSFSGAGGVAATALSFGGPLAVWTSATGQLYFSAQTAGSWSAATAINNAFVQPNGQGVALAELAGGQAFAAYIGVDQNEYYSIYSGGTWSPVGSLNLGIAGQLSNPAGLALDAAGNLYLADSGNNRVLEFTLSGALGSNPTYGAMAVVTSSVLNPQGLAFDGAGNLYIADAGNGRIVMESAASVPEPSSGAAILGLAALAAILMQRRRPADRAAI